MEHLFFSCPLAKYPWNVASVALGINAKCENFNECIGFRVTLTEIEGSLSLQRMQNRLMHVDKLEKYYPSFHTYSLH